MAKKITLLGSTGSIGTQSLDVIRAQGYEVFGLSAHSQTDKILQQIEIGAEGGSEQLAIAASQNWVSSVVEPWLMLTPATISGEISEKLAGEGSPLTLALVLTTAFWKRKHSS